MSTSMTTLPQLAGPLFLTDGGIETSLIFHDGIDLPHFAAFDLLNSEQGRQALIRYYERYLSIAGSDGLGFILESPTWRASRDWGALLGYAPAQIASINEAAVALMRDLAAKHRSCVPDIVVSGCVGPRGDGYDPGTAMSEAEAERYHADQIAAFGRAGADMTTAITMTNTPEAIGVTRAAMAAGLPVAISFTLETDGNLPTGQSLAEAIAAVDAASGAAPAYYMINCAHPTHFDEMLQEGGEWTRRIRGLRANASSRSHAELDAAPDLDEGNPQELGQQYRDLRWRHPQITVLGGCCGTDQRHIACISHACRRDDAPTTGNEARTTPALARETA